jgi:Cyclin, N-terminal domain
MEKIDHSDLEAMKVDRNPEEEFDSDDNSLSILLCNEVLGPEEKIIFNPEPEIRDSEENWRPLYSTYIISHQSKEALYHPPFTDINHCPCNISDSMRAILIDWVQKFCKDSRYKRESFHKFISHLDRILCTVSSINPDNFQLYGILALYIATKTIEDSVTPSLQHFYIEEGGFSINDMKKLELKMLKDLCWRIFPPTRYDLLICIMKEWDNYILKIFSTLPNNNLSLYDSMDEPLRSRHIQAYNNRVITFLECNSVSYGRYMESTELLDFASLDYQINMFSPSSLIAGLVYLVLIQFFERSEYSLIRWTGILERAPLTPLFNYREHCEILILNFLAQTLSVNGEMILEPARFLYQFLIQGAAGQRFDISNITVNAI